MTDSEFWKMSYRNPAKFDEAIEKVKNGSLDWADWNWCINVAVKDAEYGAYIMGEGSEQCLACKQRFSTEQEIRDLYASIGVRPSCVIFI